MTPILHIRLLGNFRLIYDDKPITSLDTARIQAFLAYLVLHQDAPQSRRHLAFLLWPDSTETQARTNLRHLLHNLHHALPEAYRFLQVDTQTLRWRPDAPFILDTAEFEAALSRAVSPPDLQAAIEIYRGELLPSCYDDWILPERERLHQKYIEALKHLAYQFEERREYTQALVYGQRLLQVDPLREESYRLLMRLYSLSGNRVEALRVYHRYASVLKQELGVTPSLATEEIYQRLVGQEGMAESHSSSVQEETPVLVGREMEWQQLMGAWQRVSQGEPHCVLVRGEAGIGKTRLLEELQVWAERQGFTTAHSRAYAATRQLAYGPVMAWLRGSFQPVWPRLELVWLIELARLIPEVLTWRPDLPPPPPLTDSWQRVRLFEALAQTVLAARLPCLLILDDLQWCDAETVEWLGYLLHFAGISKLLLVGTLRSEEVDEGHPLISLQRDLRQSGLLSEMELGPLDRMGTARLAEQVAPYPLAAEMVERLYRETEGNPLFIVEMVRAGQNNRDLPPVAFGMMNLTERVIVPSRVQVVIETRLTHLSSPTRDLVNLAAVIGREFSFELLRATRVVEDEILVTALEEAERKRILRERGTVTYDFSHDKIREITYTGLSTARRRLLHSLVAGALERLNQSNRERLSGQLAYHYERAGMPEPAARYYWQAAQAARQICALPETISYLQQGLAMLEGLPDTSERAQLAFNFLSMLGTTFAAQKGYAAPEMGDAYKQALILAPRVGDTVQVGLVQFGLYLYYMTGADLPHAQELVQVMLVKAETCQDPALFEFAYHASGLLLMYKGQFTQAREHLEKSIVQPTDQIIQYISEFRVVNISFLAITLWYLGFPDQAQQVMSLLNQTEAQNDRIAQMAFLAGLAWFNHCRRLPEIVLKVSQDGLAYSTHHGLVFWQAIFSLYQSWAVVNLEQTIPTEITHQMNKTLRHVLTTGPLAHLNRWLVLLAETCYITGQIETGIETINEAIGFLQKIQEGWFEAEIYRLKGELLLALSVSHQDEAENCFQQALFVARNQQAKSLELRVAMSLGRLWHAQGLPQKTQAAYTLLTEVYNWFTEGFDTPDLIEAKALLDELAHEL